MCHFDEFHSDPDTDLDSVHDSHVYISLVNEALYRSPKSPLHRTQHCSLASSNSLTLVAGFNTFVSVFNDLRTIVFVINDPPTFVMHTCIVWPS
jgi:hypothetical protein